MPIKQEGYKLLLEDHVLKVLLKLIVLLILIPKLVVHFGKLSAPKLVVPLLLFVGDPLS